jgi:ankyrin repeat protein
MTLGFYLSSFSWTYCCALQYGETPLHMAAKNGCSDAARLLLAHGAFIEAKANVIFLLTL